MNIIKLIKCSFLLLSLFCISLPSYAMDSGESNHGNSSFFGKLLTAAQDHPVIAGTLLVGASLSGVVAYKMHQTSKAKSLTYLSQLITSAPSNALDIINTTEASFYKEVQSFRHADNKMVLLQRLLEQYGKKYPIFLLGECMRENCGLTRKYWPQYRTAFEERAKSLLLEKLKGEQLIHYVGFGAGGLFQDLVVLAKTLREQPSASIVINLIDPKFTPYVYCKDTAQINREVKENDFLDIQPIKNDLLKQAREQWGSKNEDDVTIIEEISATCLVQEATLKQFIRTLMHIAPEAKLSLLVHESTQSYLKYIEMNQLPSPDVIAAADIQDEMSQLNHAPQHYTLLCIKTLQKKPSTSNVFLAHNSKKLNSASLETISLQETEANSANKFEYEYEPGQRAILYSSTEKLGTE